MNKSYHVFFLVSKVEEDMTLQSYQEQVCSSYLLKPRKGNFKRYTPNDYVTRGNKAIVDSDDETPQRKALRRVRYDEEEDESKNIEEEEEELEV
jgi:hypothetical protein